MTLFNRFVKYGAVSVVSTTVTMSTLGGLVYLAVLPAGWANVVATAAGTVPSFELNRRWVWGKQGRRSILREIGPFCTLSAIGLVLSTIAVSVGTAWVTNLGYGPSVQGLVADASNLAAFGSLWLVQFVVLDRVLFRAGEDDLAGVHAPPDAFEAA
jgi:putative flippase GtrA